VDGFLLAPGYIDLSELRFHTVGGDGYEDDDAEIMQGGDDDDIFKEEGEGDDAPRFLEDGQNNFMMEGSEVDIAVFHLVSYRHRFFTSRRARKFVA
jgi:hypothetical protein